MYANSLKYYFLGNLLIGNERATLMTSNIMFKRYMYNHYVRKTYKVEMFLIHLSFLFFTMICRTMRDFDNGCVLSKYCSKLKTWNSTCPSGPHNVTWFLALYSIRLVSCALEPHWRASWIQLPNRKCGSDASNVSMSASRVNMSLPAVL